MKAADTFSAQRGLLTPDEALAVLREGNDRFLAGEANPDVANTQRRLELARGQQPFAVLVGCSDSRVSPDILFGRHLGELFIVRNAGNCIGKTALGSIEYAVLSFGVPLIVVLGHEKCGAVAAAVSAVETNATFPGNIASIVEPIIPAVLAAREKPGDLLENAVHENTRRIVLGLRANPLLRGPVEAGALKIVGAHYALASGAVAFF